MFGQFFAPLWVRIAAAVFGLLLVALHADPESPGAVLQAVRGLRRKLEAEGF